MIKTPHRLLHDALSKEDYARVLVNMREQHDGKPDDKSFFDAENARHALFDAFVWRNSGESNGYWYDIHQGISI